MDRNADLLMKIVIVGHDYVGKSCLVLSYADKIFSDNYLNTIGVDFKVKSIELLGKLIRFQLWDTAGLERFRNITNAYYRGANGIIIVIDLTNSSALENAQYWKNQLDNELKESRTSILLIGNKTDLQSQRVISYDQAKALADELGVCYIETSAKINHNVDKAFEVLIWIILNRIHDETLFYRRLPYSS